MRYNTLDDHAHVFAIPEMMAGDRPLFLGITDLSDCASRQRWAYTFATGPYDADVQLQGDDLSGPSGDVLRAVEAVLGFYSSYADGKINDAGVLVSQGEEIATGETAVFIKANGERFGSAASDLEHGYLAYGNDYDDYLGELVSARTARPTGKEEE